MNSQRKIVSYIGLSTLMFLTINPTGLLAENIAPADHGTDITFTLYAALDLATIAPPGVGSNRGESIVVDGNLFKSGDGMEGANANNDPNSGDIVGKIHCRATVLDPDPSHPFGTFVTELYVFPDEITNLLADGIGPNLGFTSHRIVAGGTGRFRNVVGEIEETEIGFNKTGGCNLRVRFKLKRVDGQENHR